MSSHLKWISESPNYLHPFSSLASKCIVQKVPDTGSTKLM